MCLAQFASMYDRTTQSKPTTNDEDDNVDDPSVTESDDHDGLPKAITLHDTDIIMKKRKHPAVPRWHVVSENKNPEKYYHQQLLLFLPWRQEEEDLLNHHEIYEDSYNEKLPIIIENKNQIAKYANLVALAVEQFLENGPPQHAWDMLDPEGNIRNLEDSVNRQNDNDDCDNEPTVRPQLHSAISTSVRKHEISDEELATLIQSLNKEQMVLFRHIHDWCVRYKMGLSPKPFHIFLTGGAGTGKSRLVRALYHQVSRTLLASGQNPDHPSIILTASTGTAAFNIGGATIHSALKLPVKGSYYSLRCNPSVLATYQSKYENLVILVIDEISMLGRKVFAQIHKRLQEIKNFEGSDKIFGNVCILAVGDMFQIPPIQAFKIYDTESPSSQDEIGLLLSGLWTNCFMVHELQIIMRQKDDLPFAEMLNRVRKADHTEEDIEVLRGRVVGNRPYPTEALHIFATKKRVQLHNDTMLEQLDPETHKNIKAITRIPASVSSFNVNDAVSDLPYILAPRARVMLVKNLDVNDGLVNGATGIVLDLIYSPNVNPPSLPKCVVVKFDDPTSGLLTRQASTISMSNYPGGTPICPIEVQEHIGRSETSPQIHRIQIPLILCFACTIHKIQGTTLTNVVMSCTGINKPGMMYVACSRVTELSGLHLLDFKPDAIKSCGKTKEEMTRLRSDMPLKTFFHKLEKDQSRTRMLVFNIRSVLNKESILNSDLYLKQVDIIILTETWKKTKSNLNLDQFPHQHHDIRSDEQTDVTAVGGGVSVLSKIPVTPVLLNKVPATECNAAVVACTINNVHTNIIAIYRRPYCKFKIFMQWLTKVIASVDRDKPTVIAGDFNVNLRESSPESRAVNVFMDHLNFQQIVQAPTHQLGALLDHVWINSNITCSQIMLASAHYSDHFQVFTDLEI